MTTIRCRNSKLQSTFVVVLIQSLVFHIFMISPMLRGVQTTADLLSRQFPFYPRPEHDQGQEEQEPLKGVYHIKEDPGRRTE